MKKAMIFLAILCALGTSMFISAFATSPDISGDVVAGKPGQTVLLKINLQNNPGLAALQLEVSYNGENLKLKGISGIGEEYAFSQGIFVPGPVTNNPVNLVWTHSDVNGKLSDTNKNGILAILEFEIKPQAVIGNNSININVKSANNSFENKVVLSSVAASIDVTPLSDAETPSIKAASKSVVRNEYFEVPVSIANNPGIAAMDLSISYDNTALLLVSAKNSQGWESGQQSEVGTIPFKYVWASTSQNLKTDGIIMTLLFKVKDAAEVKSFDIILSGTAADIDELPLTVTMKKAIITVVNKPIIEAISCVGSGNKTLSVNVSLLKLTPDEANRNVIVAAFHDKEMLAIAMDTYQWTSQSEYSVVLEKKLTFFDSGFNNITIKVFNLNSSISLTPEVAMQTLNFSLS